MSKYEGKVSNYVIVRKDKDDNEALLQISEYDMSTFIVDAIDQATKFETKEQAENIANVQNMMSNFMNLGLQFGVLQNEVIVSKVEEE